jgi:hypothetical protein
MILVTTFVSLTALPHCLADKLVMRHEVMNDMYSVLPQVAANLLCRFIVITIVNLLFAISATQLMGIMHDHKGDQFFTFLLILYLANYFAEVFMLTLGLLAGNALIGIAMGVTLYGVFMLMSGTFIVAARMNPYMRWVSFFSYYKYAIEGMLNNALPTMEFRCPDLLKPYVSPKDWNACVTTGDEVLKTNYDAGGTYFFDNKWKDIGILAFFLMASIAIYGLLLRRSVGQRISYNLLLPMHPDDMKRGQASGGDSTPKRAMEL